MPEYIERFFLEAYRSFGGTITPVKSKLPSPLGGEGWGEGFGLVNQPGAA